MSYTIERLRALSDAKLIEQHDRAAENTVTGVSYYLDELRRRELMRAMRATDRLAKGSFVLAAVNTVVALLALLVAVRA